MNNSESRIASLIGAPTDVGASDRGASMGPEALRVAGLHEALTRRGLQVVDALTARWGSFRAARAQVVWCDLGQPLPASTVEAWAWLNALLAGPALGTGPGESRR